MNKFAEKICKNKKLILIITSILLILSFIGIKMTRINYDILVYLPDDIETIKGQKILTDDFNMGAYSITIIENMESKDIIALENDIRNVKGVNKVVSLYDVIGTNIPVDILPNEIKEHLNKDNTDLLFITFKDSTSSNETIDAVKEIRKITKDKCKMGGMSSMVLDTMDLSEKEIFIYIVIAVTLCIIVLLLSLDSYLIPILLLLNIGCAIVINLGTNVFLGEISYITKALVAVLQLGVTTDFSIFLYHSYEKKKKECKNNDEAMINAIKETFTSVLGSSLTTIAGFLVLCTMTLTIGRDLGIVMAKGVLLGVISVLTLFPSMLLIFDKYIEKTKHKKLNISFEKFNKFVVKNYLPIFIIFVILVIPAYLGYKNTKVYYKIDESLPKNLESIKANTILKEKFNIASPEIILISNDLKSNDVLDMINEIKNVDGIEFVISFDELKNMGLSNNIIPTDLLKLFKNDKYEMVLLNSKYEVASDDVNRQIDEINKIVKKYDKNSIVAGEGPLMKDLITTSDTDFNNVNTSSIICIFIILFIVLKSISLPFLLILTIESAIFINMSISYFSGVTLPFIAPIVLGTIQLGATIDYAILLTTSYINRRNNGLDKKDAMLKTLNYNGGSILVSGLCFFFATFGVGVYSKLEMVGSLCTLISRGAIISMLVVLTILPSILIIFDKLIIKTTKGSNTNMKNNLKKVRAMIFIIAITLTSMPINGNALMKDETVYTKLKYDGSVKNIYVNEHLINDEKSDTITDYSILNDIININGNETYKKTDNKLVWNALGKDIFYEGKYKKELPINMHITYKLNGIETDPKDMLGKKGNITITIKYENNDSHIVNINGKYQTLYTPFVVTYMTTISNEYNTNIKVENGNITSNGNKNIILGILTPGLYESIGIDKLYGTDTLTINYDTTYFELNGMYSVITPKLISNSDLSIFNKIDTLYKSVDELNNNMDLIDESAKKLKNGSNNLKNTLKSKLNNLDKEIDDNELSNIQKQVSLKIQNTFTDEYKKQIQDKTWNEVYKNMESGNNEITDIVKEEVVNAVTNYLEQQALICKNANNQEMTEDEKLSCLLINNEEFKISLTNAFINTSTNVANKVSINVAKKVSDQVSTKISEESSIKTANNIVPELIETITNKSNNVVKESLIELYNAIEQIDNGIDELSNGISKYNNDGIKKLTNGINNNVKEKEEKIKALINISSEYKTLDSNYLNNSKTKFVLVVDSMKEEKQKEEITIVKEKETFWQRILNLFK